MTLEEGIQRPKSPALQKKQNKQVLEDQKEGDGIVLKVEERWCDIFWCIALLEFCKIVDSLWYQMMVYVMY